jgi:tetratricopeptide (TPR) repeat protein
MWLVVIIRFALVAVCFWLMEVAPSSTQVERWWHQGEQAAVQGHTCEVSEAFGRILSYTGPSIRVYQRLADLSFEQQRYSDSQIYLYALAEIAGWNETREKQLAVVLEKNGEHSQAVALLQETADEMADPATLRLLAQQQIARMDWSQAEATLARWLVLQADATEAAYWLGLLLAPQAPDLAAEYLWRASSDPKLSSAADAVRAALRVYESYSLTDAHTYVGTVLVGLQEWPFAEQALQYALDVNSLNPRALAYLGYVRDKQGRDGMSEIEKALAMSPNDPEIHYLLGMHWRLLSDHESAFDAFHTAFWLSPDNPALAAEVATTLQNLGDYERAEDWFRLAVDLAPIDGRWYVLLAAFYADTGVNLETAGFLAIEEAAQLVPDDPDVHASLGWAYYRLGDVDRAYEELSYAVTLDPSHIRSRYYFAVVLEAQGSPEAAADSYRFVVERVGSDQGFGLLAARALSRLGMGFS